jgi:hypothetical protein
LLTLVTMFATRRIGEVGVCFVARVAAVLRLVERPNRFRQKERHSGEGYRVTGDIYPPAFHLTITRTDYLSATTFPVEALRQRGSLFLYGKRLTRLLSCINFGDRHGFRSASELYSARHEPGRTRRSRQDEAHSDSRLGRSYPYLRPQHQHPTKTPPHPRFLA